MTITDIKEERLLIGRTSYYDVTVKIDDTELQLGIIDEIDFLYGPDKRDWEFRFFDDEDTINALSDEDRKALEDYIQALDLSELK